MNRLSEALRRVDIDEIDVVATEVGIDAVRTALTMPDPAEVQRLHEVETQRQHDLDSALADCIELVARHRRRIGRQVCSRKDGETVRKLWELLRSMAADSGADNDPSFQ